MFLCEVPFYIGSLSPNLIFTLSQVLVGIDIIGFVNVVLAGSAIPISMLNFPGMFVLSFVGRTRTVVAVADKEVVLPSQILNDVVAIVER